MRIRPQHWADHAMDRAAVERSWKERGFSCGLWGDPPGQVWEDYVHDVDELVMVLDGEVAFSSARNRVALFIVASSSRAPLERLDHAERVHVLGGDPCVGHPWARILTVMPGISDQSTRKRRIERERTARWKRISAFVRARREELG